MMRCVTVARSEIHEEGLVRGDRMLRLNPINGTISHIADQNVVWVSEWWKHWLRVFEQGGMPVVCIAAEESVEVFEAHPAWPLIERPVGAFQPVRNQVVLTEPRCVVTISDKDVADSACAFRNNRVIARIPGREFRDITEPDAVMVSTSEQRSPRGRAECRGV